MKDFIRRFLSKPQNGQETKPPPANIKSREEILDILDVCLSNRTRLVQYFQAVDNIYRSSIVGGQNRIEKYVKALSGLVYSPENIIFDVVFKNPNLMPAEKRDWFKRQLSFIFQQGIDLQLYRILNDALVYGVSFVKIVYYNDEPHLLVLHPSDVLLYYPEFPLTDEEQIIVVVNRLPYRLFMKKYSAYLPDNVAVFPERQRTQLSEWGVLAEAIERLNERSVISPEEARFELAPLTLNLDGGDIVEFYEMYYRSGDGYYMALIYDKHVFYNGPSPYVGALYPVINFTTQESKNEYGDTILRHLLPILQRLKELYDAINSLVGMAIKPPLVITGMNVSISEEEIQNALKAGGVILLTDPAAKFDQYVPKLNVEILVGLKNELENYLNSILMINEAVATGQIRNVRSAAQLSLYIQTIMSDIKYLAFRFEQFIEKLMTQIAYTLAIHNPQYAQYNVDMYIDVYSHSSSPIVYQTRMEQLLVLLKAGVLMPEDLLDIIPVPNIDKIKTRLSEIQKLAFLQNMTNNKNMEEK